MCRFFPLLLIFTLLTGCAAQNPAVETSATHPTEIQENAVPFMELAEELRAAAKYTLPEDVTDFLSLGSNLMFFSGRERTTLTLVSPDSQQTISQYETGLALSTENIVTQRSGLSYFDIHSGETVVLDNLLQEICRINAPEELTGTPLLSLNGDTLYYCTPTAIRALDTNTGISRILREAAYPVQEVSSLLLEGTVLQVTITGADGSIHALFLSTETGQLLEDYPGNILPETRGSRFFLNLQEHVRRTLFFGQAGEAPLVLHPRQTAEDCFFLEGQVLTTFRQEDVLSLDLYTLDSGLRASAFSLLPGDALRNAIPGNDGCIWLLCNGQDGNALYRWNPAETKTQDSTCYTSPRYTQQEPDQDGLDACIGYAEDMSSRHGVEILVYRDAAELQPDNYTLEYEHDAAVLRRELEALDTRLSHYPSGFLQTLAAKFDGIKICIVRQIQSTPESGNVDIAHGIQFWDGYTAHIILAAGHDTERILYHELCHLIDTVVLTESTAYDQWEDWNPVNFQYANTTAHSMNPEDWLQAGWESFLNADSMGYPKEDRANIMEYAMTPGHADRFQSPYLQEKLKLLCTGIREAFGLKKTACPFLWEQYLQIPLIPET